jgi:hypothetical protein
MWLRKVDDRILRGGDGGGSGDHTCQVVHIITASEIWLDPFTDPFGYSQCLKCTITVAFNLSKHHLSLSTVTQKNFGKMAFGTLIITCISVLKNSSTHNA